MKIINIFSLIRLLLYSFVFKIEARKFFDAYRGADDIRVLFLNLFWMVLYGEYIYE